MTQKYYNLFLDDDPRRIPHLLPWMDYPPVQWTRAKDYDEFVRIIEANGLPHMISFDHDLSDMAYKEFYRVKDQGGPINYDNIPEKTGLDCARWLANYCIDRGLPIPLYYIHTLNGPGRMNIFSVLESARKAMTMP
jgi:hypothetical protein